MFKYKKPCGTEMQKSRKREAGNGDYLDIIKVNYLSVCLSVWLKCFSIHKVKILNKVLVNHIHNTIHNYL